MKINEVFKDKISQSLWKQIQNAQEYLFKELDKNITKQLILRIVEKGYLPVLEYPLRENPFIFPMNYSEQRDQQINIHTPIPTLKLYSKNDYPKTFDSLTFDKLLEDFKQRVEKIDQY